MFGYIFGGAIIGGISGYATAGVGNAVTGAVGTGLAGWSGAGFTAATVGGAAGSAVGGAISGFGTGLMSGASGGQIWEQMWKGAVIGGLAGGATSALSYGLSSSFRWQTHKTVIEWASNHGKYDAAIDYVAGIEKMNPSQFKYNNGLNAGEEKLKSWEKTQGWTDPNVDPYVAEIGPEAFKGTNGSFDTSNLYETVWHEGQHINMMEKRGLDFKSMFSYELEPHVNAQHAAIYPKTFNHQYAKYWSNYVTSQAAHMTGRNLQHIPLINAYGY